MKLIAPQCRFWAGFVVVALCLGLVQTAFANQANGTIYYTTYGEVFQNGSPYQVWRVDYNYTGNGTVGNGVFTLSNNTGLADTFGADGIVFLPNGNLAIGGQNTGLVHEVTTTGTIVGSQASNAGGGGAYHLALDPTGTQIYATGIPGDVGALPVSGGLAGAGSFHDVVGSVQFLTSLAYRPNDNLWYYTSSGSGGFGSFGTVSGVGGGGVYTTTQLASGVPSAHGMAYDPFTGDLMLMGDGQISQYRPGSGFISTLSVAGVNFDQGTVDGQGHLFVASNFGSLLFLDYSTTGLVGAANNFQALPFLNTYLDDVAPLVGPGAQVPEPSFYVSVALLGGFIGIRAWRKKKTA